MFRRNFGITLAGPAGCGKSTFSALWEQAVAGYFGAGQDLFLRTANESLERAAQLRTALAAGRYPNADGGEAYHKMVYHGAGGLSYGFKVTLHDVNGPAQESVARRLAPGSSPNPAAGSPVGADIDQELEQAFGQVLAGGDTPRAAYEADAFLLCVDTGLALIRKMRYGHDLSRFMRIRGHVSRPRVGAVVFTKFDELIKHPSSDLNIPADPYGAGMADWKSVLVPFTKSTLKDVWKEFQEFQLDQDLLVIPAWATWEINGGVSALKYPESLLQQFIASLIERLWT